MNAGRLISGAVLGTTMMSVYSYYISQKENKNFREPDLIAVMVKRILPDITKKESLIAGWVLHYSAGLFFAALYDKAFKNAEKKNAFTTGVLVGGINGLIAIPIWSSAFELHPSPPKIKYNRYYRHLVATHLVFGIFSFLGFKVKTKSFNRNIK